MRHHAVAISRVFRESTDAPELPVPHRPVRRRAGAGTAARAGVRVRVRAGRGGGRRAGRDGNGGRQGRITVTYQFTEPGAGITLFSRTMTIESYRHAPLPAKFFLIVDPANIDAYHAAVARELATASTVP